MLDAHADRADLELRLTVILDNRAGVREGITADCGQMGNPARLSCARLLGPNLLCFALPFGPT
jgi:hypothetical protein